MNNRDIFRHAASALENGRQVALITVTATTGSTPGKAGYKMLVFDRDEETAGTVGGGLVEAKMAAEARQMLGRPGRRSFRFELGTTPEDENGICGGSVEFLIEAFDGTALPLLRELAAVADSTEGGVLVSTISPGGPPRKIHLPTGGQADAVGDSEFPGEVTAAIKEAAATGGLGLRVSAGTTEVFVESLTQAPTVVLFGAGHLSYYIARYAKSVHFRVVVCDDRAEYANRERFPDADDVIVEDFGRVFGRMRIDRSSYLVIVTRGHKCDTAVLEQAVTTNARYIGMIGSRRKTLTVLEKLRQRGIAKELLNEVYSPIGLAVGAVTPEEIALSIVCELIKVRRRGDEVPVGHMAIARRDEGER